MTNPQVQNDPIYSLPFLYINGLLLSNDATSPNTVIDVAAGQCRDSNDIMDLVLGAANLEGVSVTAPLSLNAAVNGANGLDTGALAASSMYAIYLIGDSRYYKPVACIATLASNALPLVPFGYDSLRLIGYWPTDVSSHFIKGYMAAAVGGARQFIYDAPQATAVTAGASTSYAAVDLSSQVPPVNNSLVMIQAVLTPNAAADTLKLQGANSTGDAWTFAGQVAAVAVDCYANVLAQLVSAAPKINYKVSTGSAAVAINVQGFSLAL